MTRLRRLLAVVWRVAVFFLSFGLVAGLFIVPLDSLLSQWRAESPAQAQVATDVLGAAAILLATWLMFRFVDRRPFATFGLGFGSAARGLLAGLALGSVWLALSVGTAWAAGWAAGWALPSSSEKFALGALLLATISVFFNVLTQQLLLCGYILQTIRSRFGFGAALLVSSVLFSLYHAGAFQGAWLPAVNVFLAAVLFCLAYGISGDLWFPVGIHFAWNLLLGPVLGLTVSGSEEMGLGWSLFELEGPAWLTGGDFGLEGGFVVTATTVVLVAALARVRSKRTPAVEIDDG